MSVDRYFYIVLPKGSLRWRTSQNAFFTCLAIWASKSCDRNEDETLWFFSCHSSDYSLSSHLAFTGTEFSSLWREWSRELSGLLLCLLLVLRHSLDGHHYLLFKISRTRNPIESADHQSHETGRRDNLRARVDVYLLLLCSLANHAEIAQSETKTSHTHGKSRPKHLGIRSVSTQKSVVECHQTCQAPRLRVVRLISLSPHCLNPDI